MKYIVMYMHKENYNSDNPTEKQMKVALISAKSFAKAEKKIIRRNNKEIQILQMSVYY